MAEQRDTGHGTGNHGRHWRIAPRTAQSNYLCRVLGINSLPAVLLLLLLSDASSVKVTLLSMNITRAWR